MRLPKPALWAFLTIAVTASVIALFYPRGEGVDLRPGPPAPPATRALGATSTAGRRLLNPVQAKRPVALLLERPKLGERLNPVNVGLTTPERAVTTAVSYLTQGQDEPFRQTFLPAIAQELTQEVIERCRVYVRNTPVRPDWEVAEDAVVDGHPVKRVSMFGKSMTGFHQVDGRWLADRVWCLPIVP